MQDLRANTQVIVTVGPFVDKDDGLTPETGITLGAADEAELIKHGSTAVVDISGATWAAVTSMDGYYSLTLTTSHTDTEGQVTIAINDDSVCLPVLVRFRVLSEAAYDSLYAAKDAGFMDVNIKTVGRADTQETEADNLETACANYSATRGLTGTALPAAAADAAGGLPVSDAGGLDVDAIKTKTDFLPSATAGAAGGVFIAGTNAATTVTTSFTTTFTGNLTGDVQGNVDGSVASVTAGVTLANGAHGGGSASITLSDYSDFQGSAGQNPFQVASGTIGATGNDTTHLHLTGQGFGDDEINDLLIVIYDVSETEYHSRWITDWVNSSALAEVATLPFTPQDSTDTYTVLGVRRDTTPAATEARLAELDAANMPADVDTLLTRVSQSLNVTASGNIGIDWANVENPTTAVDLSATDIQLCDTTTTLTNKTGFSLSSTGMDSVTLPAGIITAVSIAASALDGKGDWNTVTPDAAGTVPTDGTLTVTLADGVTHGGTTAMLRLGASGSTPAFYVTNSSATAGSGHDAVRFQGGFGQVSGGDGLNLGGGGMLSLGTPGIGLRSSAGIIDGYNLADWKNAGRLDTILDEITSQGDTNESKLDTAQADLDIITGADGVNLLSATQTSIDAIEADTNELQTDDYPTRFDTLDTSIATVDTNVDTLLGRITSTLFSGITSLSEWLGLMAGKQTADATALAEIKTTGAGSGTYSETTDSLEALRDNQGGGAGGDATEAKQDSIISLIGTPADTDIATDIANLPTAAEIDTQLTGTHGSGAWDAGGAGSGARTVTVTVDDGSDPIENARIRFTEGVNTYTADTDASGNATFNLDDATYTVAILKAGYTFAGTTEAITGDATPTYSMTAVTVSASDPGFTTLYADVYVENAATLEYEKAGAGETVYLELVTAPSGTGTVLDSAVRTATTDANGRVQWVNCIQGAVYQVYYGSNQAKYPKVSVTIGVSATQAAPNVVGT